jgi:hypothetical protein
MLEAFGETHVDIRDRGLVKPILFAGREFAGLARGLVLEHTAKWVAQRAYVTSRCAVRHDSELPTEIVDLQLRLEKVLRSMEAAIAQHDFPKARFYSNEEIKTRALLQKRLNQYERDKPIVFTGTRPSSGEYA